MLSMFLPWLIVAIGVGYSGVYVYDAISDYLRTKSPIVCFYPTDSSLAENQIIQCHLAHPGKYPPSQTLYDHEKGMCCFDEELEFGVFWAIGESVMSRVTLVDSMDGFSNEMKGYHPDSRRYPFELHQARLLDIHVVDNRDDNPITDAHVTMSDDSVHLVSYGKMTDEDGYVVLPVIPGNHYMLTVRADGYLPASPFEISSDDVYQNTVEENMPDSDEVSLVHERIVELDPGMTVFGNVVNHRNIPMENAQLHIEVQKSDGSTWHSDIDQPRPVSALASLTRQIWFPRRSNYRTDYTGYYYIETVPQGKLSIYATHPMYPPSSVVSIDASELDEVPAGTLQLREPKRAFIRVENSLGAALSGSLTIIDTLTGYEMETVMMSATGALERKGLPESVKFRVIADGYMPFEETRILKGEDEIVIVPPDQGVEIRQVYVHNELNQPIAGATVSIADPEVQQLYPTCLSQTSTNGKASMISCPSSCWMEIYHSDYARHISFFDNTLASHDVVLSRGKSIAIKLFAGNDPVDASCRVEQRYIYGNQSYTSRYDISSIHGMLYLNNMPLESQNDLICSYGSDTVRETFGTENSPEKIVFTHQSERMSVVMDQFGGGVPYARIRVGTREYETDETGRVWIKARAGMTLDIFHWQHGHLRAEWTQGEAEIDFRLPDVPSEDIQDCLATHHISYIVDSASIQINVGQDDVLEKYKLQSGDAAEECTNGYLIVVRDGRRLKVRW